MHPTKSDLHNLKRKFVLSQIAIVLLALGILFVVMVMGYRQKVINILLLRLDASTDAMASQLKANQVPLSSAGENGVFIISQNDGSVIIDRHNDTQEDEELWASWRSKLIYEMQKQKRGWIVFPDKQWWNLNQQQRIIRYIPVDELGWILATEAPRPTELELLRQVIKPNVIFTLIAIFLMAAGILWWMTDKYFNIIKRYISQAVESNLLSLGGEEKVWRDVPLAHKPPDDLQAQVLGLDFPHELPTVPAAIKETVESQLPVQKPKEPKLLITPKEVFYPKEQLQPKEIKNQENNSDDLTVNIDQINSPVLKKILQQFRNRT